MSKLTRVCLAVAAALTPELRAVVINDYASAKHDRFASGFPSAPVPNTSSSFLGLSYNWSGVGWDPSDLRRNIAMISSQFFVYATHFQPGSTLNFYSPALGSVVSYSWTPITDVTRFRFNHPTTGQPGDFSIGKLSSPLDPTHGITPYPILQLLNPNQYLGLPLLTYGYGGSGGTAGPRIGTDTIDGFADLDLYPLNTGDSVADTRTIYHVDGGQPGNTRYQSGDSSGPLFVPWNGTLTLVGTHSAVGTDPSGNFFNFDNFIPTYLSDMAARGIAFTVVPEPADYARGAALALLAFAAARRAGAANLAGGPRNFRGGGRRRRASSAVAVGVPDGVRFIVERRRVARLVRAAARPAQDLAAARKSRSATSSCSKEPMSNHTPGTRQVYTGRRGYNH